MPTEVKNAHPAKVYHSLTGGAFAKWHPAKPDDVGQAGFVISSSNEGVRVIYRAQTGTTTGTDEQIRQLEQYAQTLEAAQVTVEANYEAQPPYLLCTAMVAAVHKPIVVDRFSVQVGDKFELNVAYRRGIQVEYVDEDASRGLPTVRTASGEQFSVRWSSLTPIATPASVPVAAE